MSRERDTATTNLMPPAAVRTDTDGPDVLSLDVAAIVRAFPDPAFVVDRQGRYLCVSEIAMRLLDKPASEFIGKTVLEMGFPEDVAANLFAQTEQVFRSGQAGLSTDILLTVNGPRWYDHHYSPIRDDRGEVAAMLCIARDVTERFLLEAERTRRQDVQEERRETEDRLRASEERLRLAQNNADIGIWDWQPASGQVVWTPELQALFGLPPYTIQTYEDWRERVHPDDIERIEAERDAALAHRQPFDLEFRILHSSGEIRWLSAKGKAIYSPAGEIVRVTGINVDITARKQTEEALRLTTERFELALQNSRIVVFTQDLDLRYTWIYNPAFGYRAEDVLGKRDSDLFERLEDAAATEALKREVIRSGLRQRQEVAIHKANEVKFYDLRVDPLVDPLGRTVGVTCAAIDVTERKRQQKEIVDLNVRLQRSITESHHRIKNNLQILSAMVDIQIIDGEETVSASELKRFGQHVRVLATLHDMLTLESKGNADQDAISLKAVLENMIPMLQAASEGRKFTLRADEAIVSLKQASAFALLVNELASNALKHGKGEIEVTLNLVSQAGAAPDPGSPQARLEICDDGPGFPAGFDPKEAANTGMELIESLGRWDLRGQILYENRAEGGARVAVTFPFPAVP